MQKGIEYLGAISHPGLNTCVNYKYISEAHFHFSKKKFELAVWGLLHKMKLSNINGDFQYTYLKLKPSIEAFSSRYIKDCACVDSPLPYSSSAIGSLVMSLVCREQRSLLLTECSAALLGLYTPTEEDEAAHFCSDYFDLHNAEYDDIQLHAFESVSDEYEFITITECLKIYSGNHLPLEIVHIGVSFFNYLLKKYSVEKFKMLYKHPEPYYAIELIYGKPRRDLELSWFTDLKKEYV